VKRREQSTLCRIAGYSSTQGLLLRSTVGPVADLPFRKGERILCAGGSRRSGTVAGIGV